MEWEVRFDAAFAVETIAFPLDVQREIAAMAGLLQRFGPQLRRPHCDTLSGSKHTNMKELRFTQPDGEWRIAFAFDPEASRYPAGWGKQIGGEPAAILQGLDQAGGRSVLRTFENTGEELGRFMMTVTVKEFMDRFSEEDRAKIAARTTELIEEELTLRDLRQAQHLTQERIAEMMGVEQESVSRLERRADLLLSTLSDYVAAMGGKLRLIAEFPDRRPVAIALCDITGNDSSKPRSPRRKAKP